ncbi:hypothetical protein RCF98_00190 [Thiothrix lacustris]|uniref:Cellulose-binding protein n=1 Tax=Thiothrix lacustris TaxID=525917 RepID=A0ABY9MQ60_9GAMM|nr:hypothetical protein [Thiothrix lacustris]WML90788.1 hypothetical protein RCF98_00190 [Thiothrix lacustris]
MNTGIKGALSPYLFRLPSLTVTALLLLLAGCGSNSGDSNNTSSNNTNNTNTNVTSGRLTLLDPTRNNAVTAISNLQYADNGSVSGAEGSFTIPSGNNLLLYLGSNTPLTVPSKASITPQDIATATCSSNADPTACTYNVSKNLERFFLSMDSDRNAANGIQLSSTANSLNLASTVSIDQFEAVLAQQLALYGQTPAALFQPSLGINSEAPQAEQNSISSPIPFADIFRVARPLREYSCQDTAYDAYGWATTPPSSTCLVRTFLLDSATQGQVPNGRYSVLYEGTGKIDYSGYAKIVSSTAGRDEIDINLPAKLDSVATNNRIGLRITSGTVKNIRIIMPGGICEGKPSTRVDSAANCPAGQYRSFEDTLRADRNAIVFNPDYLRFLKDFRVVRMMNLMEASPSYLTCAQTEVGKPNSFIRDTNNNLIFDQTCMTQEFLWDQRSKMSDAVWGASGNIARLERYGRGVPIEVQVELANQLNAHPWFNIPHNASETYIREFARYVEAHLNTGLKAHVEYSNETWNGIFWAYHYVLKKGEELGSPTDPWRGANFYAKQASKVFQIWEDEFGGTQRLVRLLATYQNDANRTERMLAYSDTKNHVDAIATGGYFYACWRNDDTNLPACNDSNKIPKPLVNATSVDDIFAAIDNANDPFGMEGLKNQFIKQAAVAEKYGKALYAYEGGQHLTIGGEIATDRKQNMLDLLQAANRDPRMGEHYQRLLDAWKSAGGQTFMLFSVPHTFSQYGSFGIKESLNQPRSSAPKYDGAMKFQESQGQCWWSGC